MDSKAFNHGIVDPMVMFYKECLERSERIIKALTAKCNSLETELQDLRRAYDHLEDYATERENVADDLREALDAVVEQLGRRVARDLLPQLNAVETIDLVSDSEEDDIMDIWSE